jgi:drug/metabolite transporter (DMT)-like permease
MWLPLALSSALGTSSMTLITKELTKNIHPLVVLFFSILFTLPFMALVLLYFGGIPQFTPFFIYLLLFVSILDIVAFIAGTWAVKLSPISLIAPISSFTPVFATLFGFLLLQEVPTPLKLVGIITIVSGTYFLNISEVTSGIHMPLKKLFSEKGVKLFLIQTIIFGLTPVFQKQAIFQTEPNSPLFVSFVGNCMVTIPLFFLAQRYIKNKSVEEKQLHTSLLWLLVFGIINAVTQLAAFTVFSLTNIGYATAVFNLSVLFTILLGGLHFKEGHIKERLLGATIMIIGTILIAL